MQSGSPFYHFKNKQAFYAVMESGMHHALERQLILWCTAMRNAQMFKPHSNLRPGCVCTLRSWAGQ